ncbi:MAG: ERF family protein [Psychroflexus sp.]|nr:ERF family protein [Psychroflexus sp.]
MSDTEKTSVRSINQKLFELQSAIGKITKNKNNPFHKSEYFDINGLLDAIKPVLQEQRLLLKQPIIKNRVYSVIVDVDTGEKQSCYLELQQNDNPQKVGSEITYYRRYTLQSLLALEAEDDDGNKASVNQNEPDKWLNETLKGSHEPTKEWLNVCEAISQGKIKSVNQVRKHYKVSKQIEEKLNQKLNK